MNLNQLLTEEFKAKYPHISQLLYQEQKAKQVQEQWAIAQKIFERAKSTTGK
ncbi:MAG: hypothetical protein AAGA75_21520 [Cyanobacteria bacterium P01_E01_bin.6]